VKLEQLYWHLLGIPTEKRQVAVVEPVEVAAQ